MPITSNAKKAHRASLSKRVINDRRRNRMREMIKKVEKDKEEQMVLTGFIPLFFL